MADPFSVTGTAGTVIVLGLTVVKSLYNISTEISNAGREIRDLSVEAATLKELLDRLYGILSQADLYLEPSQEQHLQIVLDGCRNAFADLHARLGLFLVDGKGRGKRTVQKIRWVLKKEDIRELLQRVEQLKNNLQTVLLISQSKTPREQKRYDSVYGAVISEGEKSQRHCCASKANNSSRLQLCFRIDIIHDNYHQKALPIPGLFDAE
ncbi:hypothetical protein K440DRAFT_636200 [Wilcoxina mikolae CBS 423.85]|nr:hypothetical protein K440DRAFT_636200 [Wilcoxina mikolae CBS 423.85]